MQGKNAPAVNDRPWRSRVFTPGEEIRRLRRSDFLRHSFTLLSGSVATQLVAAISAPVLGRLYHPGEYGQLGLFMALSGFLGVLASLQLPTAVVVPRSDDRARALVHLTLAASLVVAILSVAPLIVFRGEIARLLHAPDLSAWIPLVPVAVVVSTSIAAINAHVNRFHGYRAMSVSRLAGALASAVVSIWIGIAAAQAAGLFIGFFAGLLVTLLVLLVAVQKADPDLFRAIGGGRLIRVLGRYRNFAIISTPAELLNNVVQQLPLYTISGLAGAAAGGLYAMTNRLLGLPNVFISSAVSEVFRRRASVDYATTGSCRPIYVRTARTLLGLGVVPAIVLFLVGPQIFSIYLGPQWRAAGVYAQILTPLFLIRFIVSPLSYVFFIAEHQREDLIAHVAMIAATVGGMYAGYRLYRSPTYMLACYSAGYSLIYVYYLVRGYIIADRNRLSSTGAR